MSGVGFGGTTSGVVVTVAGTGPWTALVAVLVTGQRSCWSELQGLLVDRSRGAQRENTHGQRNIMLLVVLAINFNYRRIYFK